MMAGGSKHYCDESYKEEEYSIQDKSWSNNRKATHYNVNNVYFVDKKLRHVDLRPKPMYLMQCFGYGKADDIAKQPRYIFLNFIKD